MQLEEFFNYKNTLMEILCSDRDIVRLLTDQTYTAIPNHNIAYKNIFPFEYIPDTIDKCGTFICYDVDIANVENDTYLYPVLYVWIFTHKSKLRLPEGGIRLDTLSASVNKKLNGNRYFGLGKLKLQRIDRFVPTDDYQGRCLTYQSKDFNIPSASKNIPTNRREGI